MQTCSIANAFIILFFIILLLIELFSSPNISLYISQSLTNISIRDFRFMKRAHICSVLRGQISEKGATFPRKFGTGEGGGAN